MFALYEQGYTANEIARRCGEGTASVAPFQIPRRTVQQIVTTIARERRAKPPQKLEDLSGHEILERYPERVGRLLERELDRLERKEHSGKPLSLEDIERMRQGAKVVAEVRRFASSKRSAQQMGPRLAVRERSGIKSEGLIERLRREESEKAPGKDQAGVG
jgi:hypothetical protein